MKRSILSSGAKIQQRLGNTVLEGNKVAFMPFLLRVVPKCIWVAEKKVEIVRKERPQRHITHKTLARVFKHNYVSGKKEQPTWEEGEEANFIIKVCWPMLFANEDSKEDSFLWLVSLPFLFLSLKTLQSVERLRCRVFFASQFWPFPNDFARDFRIQIVLELA